MTTQGQHPKPELLASHPGHRQDRWVIEEVLKGKRGGYFVEAGAGGRSNTYLLESEYGWDGLGIEPHPARFAEIQAFRRCRLESVCLTDRETEVPFVLNHDAPGTSGIADQLGEIKDQFYSKGASYETIQIKGAPLWELLRKHEAPHVIDYLSLDIEGAEWLALKDFPFETYAFNCMTIERGGGPDYMKLRGLLLEKGYRLVRIGGADDYWVHPSVDYTPKLVDRLRTPIYRTVQAWKAKAGRSPASVSAS